MSKSWFNKLLQINEENKHLKKRIEYLEVENTNLRESLTLWYRRGVFDGKSEIALEVETLRNQERGE